ncbi:MAG TPA: Fe2+-dependent dioxygenase [Chromatiales bacterium]|nr:Fe2+-dependent dioxygenase [Chromatiales bacterium]
MLLEIPHVLGPGDLRRVRETLAQVPFIDGRASAGAAARQVKHNEEAAPDDARIRRLNEIVMGNLVRHPWFQHAALPHRVASPFYARYAPGMTYGDHVDDPIMGPAQGRYRTDVSITVFLSAPDDYEGGELVIHTQFGPRTVKLPGGHAVLYPASSRHHVAPVTRGERLVAVTWVQSLVRDPAKRELLWELGRARDRLLAKAPEAEETRQVDKSYVNLLRMWVEL